MIASSASRWAIRGRPVAAGGSDSASSGATTAHSASGTRQIGGSAGRAFFGRAITHLPRVVPHDLFPSEIVTYADKALRCRSGGNPFAAAAGEQEFLVKK